MILPGLANGGPSRTEAGTEDAGVGLLVSQVLRREIPSFPKNVRHSRKRTVNIETRSVLQQDSWILFAGRRAKPYQFHGVTWFGVTSSGKSLLPRQFWYQIVLEFRALCCAAMWSILCR
jgi:hypothetical protein